MLGLTQDQLAKRLGTTWVTINRIENGSLKISRKLALRLSALTGVQYGDIKENEPGPLRTWHGQLSSGRLDQLDQMARELAPRQLKTLIGNATYRAELILTAALQQDAARKFWTLDAAIEAMFDELEHEFGLQRLVRQLRKANGKPEIVAWIKERVGEPPAGLFKEAAEALSGRSMKDRAAKKLAAVKKRPTISLRRAKSSKKRQRRGT
jgi:DNA-binding XRE family transcriptional regulator